MNFPIFPHFRKLVPEDRDEYLNLYGLVEPYSDFSFNNLIIWLDLNDDLEVSQYQGCILLRFTNPFEHTKKERAYTVLGNKNCLEVVQSIFEHQQSEKEVPKLIMVPECVVSDMLQTHDLPQNLVIRASRNHCDYIFNVNEVVAAQGGAYEELRRSLRLFAKKNAGEVAVQTFDLGQPETHARLLAALKDWQKDEGFVANDPTFDEEKALKRYFTFNKACPAVCQGFFLDGKLFGFTIIHYPPQKDWVIFNHLKCSRDVPHGYDFMYYATMCQLKTQQITSVNFEQDLGITGLSLHKRHLGRSDYLYRYDVSRF